jgi:hypothetical protein
MWEHEQISMSFSLNDKESSLIKLSAAALRIEDTADITKLGFDSLLTPYEFKLQLEKTLKLALTPEETGALIDYVRCNTGENHSKYYLKKRGNASDLIDGRVFGNKFCRIRAEAWRIHGREQKVIADKILSLRLKGQNVDMAPSVLGR